MLNPARLEALRHKHNLLSRQIEFEEGRPAVNRGLIVQLKREKMRVKEILSGIRADTVFHGQYHQGDSAQQSVAG